MQFFTKTIKNNWNLLFLAILAGVLNCCNLARLGYGNSYYAAAIKSMSTSFSNFFFVSYDSTGFISVDKAPLSLWLDTIFAKILGFGGVSILLPHALTGVAVTILTYLIVKRVAGNLPAFIAGLLITLSPVNVAVYRNNTPDSLLLMFVLLAIWFVLLFLDNKKRHYLLLSAAMVGLGFNTKMLQAYLVLPAVLGVVFLFSPGNWLARLKNSLVYLFVTLLVSFTWITIVDLTPASLRPFVGGSENNSAWNLALFYNGAQRLLGETGVGNRNGFNVAEKGIFRLFIGEMGTQSGWFLLTALLYSAYFLGRNFSRLLKRLRGAQVPFTTLEILNVLNVAFLLVGFVFFSYAGFFHSYYLNIFALPIAFLVGGVVAEIQAQPQNKWLPLLLALSLPMQAYLIFQASYATWLIPTISVLGILALVGYFLARTRVLSTIAVTAALVSLFLAPLIWSGYTTLVGNTASPIFVGGPSVGGSGFGRGNGGFTPPQNQNQGGGGAFMASSVNADLLAYLQAHYKGEKYFLAVSSQQQASGFILDENITNIMTLGGFSGRDQVITLAQFKQKITSGELRYAYLSNDNRGGVPGMFGGSNGALPALPNDGQTGQWDGNRQFPPPGNPPFAAGYFPNAGFGNQSGGGMFDANSEITAWVKENAQQVDSLTGLYDLSTADLQ